MNSENNKVDILNEYMSNLKVFNNNLYNLHFNIVGSSFFGMHQKLQDDSIAERIKMLSGYPITSLKKIEDVSTIKSMRSMDYNGRQVLEVLENDFNFFVDYTKDLINIFSKEGDYYTASILEDNLKFFEKQLWMVKSSMN